MNHAAYDDALRTAVAELLTESEVARELLAGVDLNNSSQARDALHALLTIRPPGPIPPTMLQAIDVVLTHEAAARPIVEADDLPGTALDPRLSLVRADITTVRADAIVNAANAALLGCFNPHHRCVDNVIHSAAGPLLREDCAEIMARRGRPEPPGTATVTPGHHLPASHVIHTVGPIVEGEPTAQQQELLARSYRSCLAAAAERGMQSIAFCCLSAGVFGYPKPAAATIAVRTVLETLPSHPCLTRVVFTVVDDIDHHLYRKILGYDLV